VPYPVLFSGECPLYSRVREKNGVFFSKENTHCTQEMEHRRPHLIIRNGMTSDFDGPMSAGVLFGNVGDVVHTAAQKQGHMDGI
jgi:hypothetical protein